MLKDPKFRGRNIWLVAVKNSLLSQKLLWVDIPLFAMARQPWQPWQSKKTEKLIATEFKLGVMRNVVHLEAAEAPDSLASRPNGPEDGHPATVGMTNTYENMCILRSIYMCIYLYNTCWCVHVWIHIVCVYIYICICIYTYIYICIYIYMYVCMYIYIHTFYVYLYIYIYIYIPHHIISYHIISYHIISYYIYYIYIFHLIYIYIYIYNVSIYI